MAIAITLGCGRRNPRGRVKQLAGGVLDLAQTLDAYRPTQVEAWWSQNVWRDDHRRTENWLSSCGVVIDLDYYDATGKHAPPSDEHRAMLDAAARAGHLTGSLFHHTTRGARVVLVFREAVGDAGVFRSAAGGAAATLAGELKKLGVPGYAVDTAPLLDLARMFYSPRSIVDGQERAADVLVMRAEEFSPASLAPRPPPSRPTRACTSFAEAAARYNQDHPGDWPRSDGTCPACGHQDCFGQLKDSPGRWACFSANHDAVGVRGARCWHGDTLDLAAHAAGVERVDLLLREGYLDGEAKAPPPTRHPPRGDAQVIPLKTIGKTYASLCTILRHDKRIIPEPLEYNAMLCGPTIGGEPIQDELIGQLRERIELLVTDIKNQGLKFAPADIEQAMRQVAAERTYNPLTEYLQGLEWDGVRRIDALAEDILNIPRTALNQTLLRKWLISAVARAMRPGEKVDHVLILVGPQGPGKSTFFSTLAGDAWFSDSGVDISNKDSLMLLRRVWIWEWSELATAQRARDIETVKSFITSRIDHFRPPFGRTVIAAPRHCVIVGTSNNEQIIADPTGARRYWILRTDKDFNLSLLAEQRDQLWAEAVAAFRAGEQWLLTPEQAVELRRAQRAFEERHPWEDLIHDFLGGTTRAVTTAEVLEAAVKKPAGQWTRGDEMTVAAILRRAGWRRPKHDIRAAGDGVRRRTWVNDPLFEHGGDQTDIG